MAGRPTRLTDELSRHICKRLACGEYLKDICKDPEMPHVRRVLDWVVNERKPEYLVFRQAYARARRAQAETWGDEIARSAMAVTPETAHAVRTKIDGLKWLLAKLHPEKWGDRVMNVHSGSLKVETVKDFAPEWMRERLKAHAPGPSPTAAATSDENEDTTIH